VSGKAEQQQQLKELLVLCATGKQGGAVAKEALKTGKFTVRLLVRDVNSPKAKKLKERGAKVYQGDMLDKRSLLEAMKGVQGVFSVQNYWESGKEKEIEEGINVIEAAKEGGVQHFVYSSVSGADKNTGIPQFESKYKIEQHLMKTGLSYTILRPVSFMENFLMPEIKEGIQNGVFKTPLKPETKLQLIAVRDIGKFAVYSFENPDRTLGKIMEISGDELTQENIAKILNCKYDHIDLKNLQKDEQTLYQWLETVGYNANIEQCKKIIPDLRDFKTFAHKKFGITQKSEKQESHRT